MKKSIVALSFFMLFIAIASFVVGCGSDKEKGNLTDILIAEKWCESEKGDPEMTFYKTGTGRYEGTLGKFDFTWEQLDGFDNCIRMEYEFMLSNGSMTKGTTDFELDMVDGRYQLSSFGEGYNYVRKSDFSK